MKMTKEKQEEKMAVVADETQSPKKRKEAYQELMDAKMNPIPDTKFNPETFDPMYEAPHYEIRRRNREEPPRRLPTKGMRPKKLFDGQMIGMYESKQDLYLLIAWLSERVSDLEDQLRN